MMKVSTNKHWMLLLLHRLVLVGGATGDLFVLYLLLAKALKTALT